MFKTMIACFMAAMFMFSSTGAIACECGKTLGICNPCEDDFDDPEDYEPDVSTSSTSNTSSKSNKQNTHQKNIKKQQTKKSAEKTPSRQTTR